jgi:GTP cyclohydrolase II
MTSDEIEIQEKENVPADARLPTTYGDFRIRVFHESSTGLDHVALTLGDMSGPDPVLVRVHSECITGDAFASTRCDCGSQLQHTLREIQKKGWGCLIYLRQEGRGIGLHAKIQAYNLQDKGADTLDANLMLGLPADARNYSIAGKILENLGIEKVALLTNNPEKVKELEIQGIKVSERVGLIVGVGDENINYLQTKSSKMGHHITSEDLKN